MQTSNDLEESLREMACTGCIEKMEVLVRAGVNVNSQNAVNGWAALHWAARRNHTHAVSYLLQSGADSTIRTVKGELAIDVTKSEDIKQMLSGKANKTVTGNVTLIPSISEWVENSSPAHAAKFIPNYISNPEFPYSEGPLEFANRLNIQRSPIAQMNTGLTCSTQAVNDNKCDDNKVVLSEPPACSLHDSVLVLRCRVAHSEEKDFIEIELDKNCLTFEALVETCTSELNVDKGKLEKIRKLPNTIVRNDCDVKRLMQFQEIEIVLNFLVLQCRFANSVDFIEIEFDREFLTFETLKDACMSGLQHMQGLVRNTSIRKLPNTIVRNDHDVKRLTHHQEIEIIEH